MPADSPASQRDYVLVTDRLTVSVARVIPDVASDHLAFLVRFGDLDALGEGDDEAG